MQYHQKDKKELINDGLACLICSNSLAVFSGRVWGKKAICHDKYICQKFLDFGESFRISSSLRSSSFEDCLKSHAIASVSAFSSKVWVIYR
jgi:hypothetical protein